MSQAASLDRHEAYDLFSQGFGEALRPSGTGISCLRGRNESTAAEAALPSHPVSTPRRPGDHGKAKSEGGWSPPELPPRIQIALHWTQVTSDDRGLGPQASPHAGRISKCLLPTFLWELLVPQTPGEAVFLHGWEKKAKGPFGRDRSSTCTWMLVSRLGATGLQLCPRLREGSRVKLQKDTGFLIRLRLHGMVVSTERCHCLTVVELQPRV